MNNGRSVKYDVAVVGAGIAGVAIAERLSREAARQDVPLSIVVVEKNAELGAESSAGLEGWLHTGFLYAKSENLTTFNHCINSLIDMVNFYRHDKLFSRWRNCNIDVLPDGETPYVDRAHAHRPTLCRPEGERSWFQVIDPNSISSSYLHFVYGRTPSITRPGATVNVTDSFNWERQRRDIFSRLDHIFWRSNWLHRDGLSKAPSIPTQFAYGPEYLGDDAKHSDDFTFSANPKLRDQLQKILKTECDIIASRDVVMNTRNIILDLAQEAIGRGVEFVLDSEVEISRAGQQIRCCAKGQILHADFFVLVCGASLAKICGGAGEITDVHEAGFDVKIRNSTMAVIDPPLVRGSFARVDLFRSQEFNHLFRICPQGHEYAIIADGNGREGRHQHFSSFDPEAFEKLREKAKSLGLRTDPIPFVCNKVESVPRTDLKVGYDYFIEPGMRAKWSEEVKNQWSVWIRDQLMGRNGHKPEIARQPGIAHATTGNFVVVLPGKFTLFPTVAEQTYLEVEARAMLFQRQPRERPHDPNIQVARLVADTLCPKCHSIEGGWR